MDSLRLTGLRKHWRLHARRPGGRPIIHHRVGRASTARLGAQGWRPTPAFDTLRVARRQLPNLDKHGLEYLAAALGLEAAAEAVEGSVHSAPYDAVSQRRCRPAFLSRCRIPTAQLFLLRPRCCAAVCERRFVRAGARSQQVDDVGCIDAQGASGVRANIRVIRVS
jgi:hypothetical protein